MIEFLKQIFKSNNSSTKNSLLGIWKAVEFEHEKIDKRGFINISISFQNNEIKVDTEHKAFGGTKTNSLGEWEIVNSHLQTRFGKNYHRSKVEFVDSNTVIFSPDPFFKSDAVPVSKYVRIIKPAANSG